MRDARPIIVSHGGVGIRNAGLAYALPPEETPDLGVEKGGLLDLIFQGGISRADGIDLLEEGSLLRIDAEIFPKFLVLGSR